MSDLAVTVDRDQRIGDGTDADGTKVHDQPFVPIGQVDAHHVTGFYTSLQQGICCRFRVIGQFPIGVTTVLLDGAEFFRGCGCCLIKIVDEEAIFPEAGFGELLLLFFGEEDVKGGCGTHCRGVHFSLALLDSGFLNHRQATGNRQCLTGDI